jgi:hypothetical protein
LNMVINKDLHMKYTGLRMLKLVLMITLCLIMIVLVPVSCISTEQPTFSSTPPTVLIPASPMTDPPFTTPAKLKDETQSGVLLFGIMLHLEGWNDGINEASFRRHATLLREYATLFEKYGAKLTLESKEMTDGSIRWGDNVLREMQQRGHALGVHADVGGSRKDTMTEMELKLTNMKSRLESLGVTVRHVSGIVSHLDWVNAAADTGYQFVTGTVAYGLASLPPEKRPIVIPDNATPGMFHQPYPFELENRITPWRAESGMNWVDDSPQGKIVIIPSGGGIQFSFEESRGDSKQTGQAEFTIEDIEAFEIELKSILTYVKSDKINTYHVSWSFGQVLDKAVLEKWLQMIDKYVAQGKVQWKTIPEIFDTYVNWERKNRK